MRSNPDSAISLPAHCMVPGIPQFKKVSGQHLALGTDECLCDPLRMRALKKHTTGTGVAWRQRF